MRVAAFAVCLGVLTGCVTTEATIEPAGEGQSTAKAAPPRSILVKHRARPEVSPLGEEFLARPPRLETNSGLPYSTGWARRRGESG